MPLILGTNSIKDTGYNITNSARFTASSTGHMERTFDHAGNRKVWTFSTWIKRSVLGVERGIFGSALNSSGTNAVNAIFFYHTGDTIRVWTQNGETAIVSGEAFRDPSAWLHLVWTAQSSSPYYKVYVNGSEINYATDNRASYPSTNDSEINQNNVIHYIGGWKNGSDQSVSSYMADTYFLDGYTYDPSYFGETDSDSGIWKPKKYAEGNYGNNGFHLEYKETGTSANSSGMGADTSGNGNHFTPQNMTAEDITTDTPTNNFATLNPLDTHSSATLSEGNLKIATTASGWFGGSGTIGITLGQPAYFEAKAISSARLYFGLSRIGQGVRGTTLNNGAEGDSNFDYMWRTTTANTVYYGGSNQSITIGAISANDICACSVASDGEVKFYLNDATVVTFSTKLIANYFYFPILSANAFGGGTETWIANFGSPAYAISSSNTDPDGHGNFEFATKGGYALNTKNLAEYG